MLQNRRNQMVIKVGVALVLWISAMLTACSGGLRRAAAPTPTQLIGVSNTPSDTKSSYTVTIAAQGNNITKGIPAGLVQLNFKNVDHDRHSASLYRLKDGIPISDFYSLFEDNPRNTLPITEALGSYEIDASQIITRDFKLLPGTYIVVDDLGNPPRYDSF